MQLVFLRVLKDPTYINWLYIAILCVLKLLFKNGNKYTFK